MKKIISILTAIFVTAAVLTGCGAKKNSDNKSTSGDKVIKIGATSNPHAIILEKIKPVLEKEGYNLEITVFDDYALLNPALANGELDANFFQHIPYLEEYNKNKNADLVSAQKVHIEPMGIYSKTLKDVSDIKAGSEITIPSDPSNGSRALKLLAKAGLITVPDKEILTVQDVAANTKNLKITEVDAKQLPNTLQDVALSVINSNYALEAKLSPTSDSLFTESGDSPYANVIAVKKGHENEEKIKALVKALTTPEVKQFILDEFKGAVVPAF